ncbi:MAG: 23S rRNA methyltransferase [Dehalococcoidia bacterium]|nr:23S rRNA methyltransferase [Dehalococcoidia bacterium]MQG16050.1 class I SAM-dependent RNA methyltransferase [SAR202 cluster bacterium]
MLDTFENIETVRLKLGEFNELGDTNAIYENSEINVFGGIPNEEVIIGIHRYKKRRKEVIFGVVLDVIVSSEHRIQAPCPYFGPCSGCQWQHIDYSYQLIIKANQVKNQFQKYKELSELNIHPTLASPNIFNYRNHARFTVRKEGVLGFVNRITRRFVSIQDCMLMTPGINRFLSLLQGKVAETSQLSIRHGINTNEWLIQPAIKSSQVQIMTGQTHYRESLLGRHFRVASPSFFQVNTLQAETLGKIVKEKCKLNGTSKVVDAYAGVGTFSAVLSDESSKVIAIEESGAAIKDAKINLAGLSNIEYIESKTEEAILNLSFKPDAVILDPPRNGCHIEVLKSIIIKRPKRVIYVSCDTTTLARDLSYLVKGGYLVIDVQPIDMFPQTHHIECVVTLEPHI